jgi:F420H(2)-dependent quinone reductase
VTDHVTSRTAAAPANVERQRRVMKVANVPMRAVLGLPFKTPLASRLMLVSYTGRKTGRAYRQPVSYVRDGETLLTPGGGRWTLNLRNGEPVRLRLAGRDVVGRPELVDDVAEVERLLRLMVSRRPSLKRFVPFIESDGSMDRSKVESAVSFGFRVVRWSLDQSRPS